MISRGELREDREGIGLGEEWLQKSERREIHSNIQGVPGMTVVDERTGTHLVEGINFSGGRIMGIGGSLLEVKKWKERKLEVRKVSEMSRADASWSYCCRTWRKGCGQPEAIHRYPGFSEFEWPVPKHIDNFYVFHFGGGRRHSVLEVILSRIFGIHRHIKVNKWFLTFEEDQFKGKPSRLTGAGPVYLELSIREKIDKLEKHSDDRCRTKNCHWMCGLRK
jgi:hypothetical protein